MVSPLPKNKRAKNPKETGDAPSSHVTAENHQIIVTANQARAAQAAKSGVVAPRVATNAAERPSTFGQNPFSDIPAPPQG
jgi:hypothetical protein